MAIGLTDITSIGSLLIFLVLLGYMVGEYFDAGYLGKPYRPKGGDFERFLKYSSIGASLIVLVSLVAIELLMGLLPDLVSVFQTNSAFVYTLILISLIYIVLLSFAITLMPYIGRGFRKLKNRIDPIEITIVTSEPWTNIDAKEIYEEDEDYFFYIDKNENWGMIKKNLVNKVTSRKKKGKPLFS